jgi:phosphatidylglycerophosphate synthase
VIENVSTNPRRTLRNDVLREHAIVLAVVLVCATVLQRALLLGEIFVAKVFVAAVVGGTLTALLAMRHLSADAFGAANRVTLMRGAMLAMLVACVGEATAAWLVVVVAGTTIALDGVDGWLARRNGTASAFGARFDMETDALSLLVLTVLVWQLGKAGTWVLGAGLLRYAFVSVAVLVPRFDRPLPERLRRKAAFVIAFILLIVAAAPIVAPPFGRALAAAALALLVASFAIDSIYLARRSDLSA